MQFVRAILFLLVTDWIMKQVQENGRNAIRWKINNKLDDLDFADDIALVSSSFQQMDEGEGDSMTEKWTPRILAQLTRSFSGSRGVIFGQAGECKTIS